MPFIEDDDAVEAFCAPCRGVAAPRLLTQPVDDLLHARALALALIGAHCRKGDEEDAFIEFDRFSLAEA